MTTAVVARNTLPELAATRFAAVADDISNDLASAAAERDPYPALAALFQHE
jgi:hypothetical protein